MRLSFAAAAMSVSLFATPAFAADPPAACDWYQTVLIGALCKGTAEVDLGIGYSETTVKSNSSDAFEQTFVKDRTSFLSEGATISITPLNWLRVSVGTSLVTQADKFGYASSSVFFPGQTFTYGFSSRETYAGFQTLEVLGRILDTGPGSSRYVLNAYGVGGFVPGSNVDSGPARVNASWQTEAGAGVEAHAAWRVGPSRWSVVARTGFEIVHQDGYHQTVAQPELAVLLSDDAAGIAFGPSAYSNVLLDRTGGVGDSAADTFLGGEIRAQPFRATSVAALRGLTLVLSGFHSTGQAGWVDTAAGRARKYVLGANLGWHFIY